MPGRAQTWFVRLLQAPLAAPCRFDAKCRRIQAESPHGRRPNWAVRPVIVKSGDDCRQELLAVQLISTFHDIFQACLPTTPCANKLLPCFQYHQHYTHASEIRDLAWCFLRQ